MQIGDWLTIPGEEREYPAHTGALEEARAFVEEKLEQVDCPMKASLQISVALEEMFVNVASYAYENGEGKLHLRVAAAPEGVLITLRDTGIPFNPLEKTDPDTTLSLNERGIGGLGVFMTKKLMDDVSYSRKNGENIFSMLKLF